MTSLRLLTRLLSVLLGNATAQLANYFDSINYFNDLKKKCIECQKKKKKQAESRTYGFELLSKLFCQNANHPPFRLLSIKLKYPGFFYAFSICFVSFYIIFVKVEFFHLNLRGNVVFTTTAIRIYFAPLTLILYTYFN